ncbi:hypothetical protein FNV43_RR23274 [Rhamnella rubrinervis]|uniref:Uncharacterized protein n=1 Tax=Rhamnella rubrinervis TaxID=2594499 RepID=A0A8K0GP00_9ROSA|nr:hypothetical protein FNV43_RR23274 [Rhamnella rubrinervis]
MLLKCSHSVQHCFSKDIRSNRAALFDGIEEGGIRASSSYSSHEIDEHDNERALEGLQDRVILLKRVSFPFVPWEVGGPEVSNTFVIVSDWFAN